MLARQREREEAERNGQKPKGRFEGMFPLSARDGWNQWWSNMPAATAESNVLSYMPYLRRPPTHTATGSAPPSTRASTTDLDNTTNVEANGAISNATEAVTKTTNSITDPYGPRTWHSTLVPLSGKNRALNEFSIVQAEDKTPAEDKQDLVILHGYGAGLGFFYKNFEPLSRAPGWRLYALDLLGMGRSSRPPFKLRSKTREEQITEAEAWFVDSLEEWRVKRKIDKFTLLGHSMGGYMAVAYALKYPGRLNKLILASPVGIPEDPYAVNADMPEPGSSAMAQEFTQDQEETTSTRPPRSDNNNFLNARQKAEREQQKANPNRLSAGSDDQPPPRKPLPKWLTYLWDANFSPFNLVRYSGPLGPRLVSGWTSRRFNHLPAAEAQALHDYAYALFRLHGSGEYALAYILAPGAFARSPLIRRIGGVGRQPLDVPLTTMNQSPTANGTAEAQGEMVRPAAGSAGQRVENGIPIVLMYGEHDWMDVNGGYAAKEKLDATKRKALEDASTEEKARDRGSNKVVIIKKAGHHVYLDGWEEFNEVMAMEMDDTVRRGKLERSWAAARG